MSNLNKHKNQPTGTFKSKLELTAAQLLFTANLQFEYEPWDIVLIDPFIYDLQSYERIGKVFKNQSTKIRAMKYTPDFVGDKWIIETKGQRTPDFNIKWKLFKKYLIEHDLEYALFMPTNKKEILSSIELIKQLYNEK